MIRLRPNIPVLWVSPTTLQLGVQRAVARIEATDEIADIVTRMRRGVHPQQLVAKLGAAAAEQLISAVLPALEHTSRRVRARVTGSLPLATSLMRALRDAGLGAGRHPADTVVSVAAWHLPDAERQRALARGIRQLPVVVGDATIAVGPLWEEGMPCWRCFGKRPDTLPVGSEPDPALTLNPLEEAAAIGAVAALLGPVTAGEAPDSTLITIDRVSCAQTRKRVKPDPACGCSANLPAPAETATADDAWHRTRRSA